MEGDSSDQKNYAHNSVRQGGGRIVDITVQIVLNVRDGATPPYFRSHLVVQKILGHHACYLAAARWFYYGAHISKSAYSFTSQMPYMGPTGVHYEGPSFMPSPSSMPYEGPFTAPGQSSTPYGAPSYVGQSAAPYLGSSHVASKGPSCTPHVGHSSAPGLGTTYGNPPEWMSRSRHFSPPYPMPSSTLGRMFDSPQAHMHETPHQQDVRPQPGDPNFISPPLPTWRDSLRGYDPCAPSMIGYRPHLDSFDEDDDTPSLRFALGALRNF